MFRRLFRKKSATEEKSASTEMQSLAEGSIIHFLANPTEANLAEAKQLGTRSPYLVLKKESVTEQHWGREWKGVSPIQFAALIGDQFALEDLLTCLVDPKQKQTAAEQLAEVLDGKIEQHGGYLGSYTKLIEIYNDYDRQVKQQFASSAMPSNKEEEKQWWIPLDDLWIKSVGGAQRQLPICGLQEFCNNKPFNEESKFDTAPRRSCMSGFKQRFVFELSERELDIKALGVSFGLGRGGGARAVERASQVVFAVAVMDGFSFARLCAVRKEQLRATIARLRALEPVIEIGSVNQP